MLIGPTLSLVRTIPWLRPASLHTQSEAVLEVWLRRTGSTS